jgi:hypothetical protein
MKSFTSRRFRETYAGLPDHVRLQARRSYQLFRQNPSHRGLNFKIVSNPYVTLGLPIIGLVLVWYAIRREHAQDVADAPRLWTPGHEPGRPKIGRPSSSPRSADGRIALP